MKRCLATLVAVLTLSGLTGCTIGVQRGPGQPAPSPTATDEHRLSGRVVTINIPQDTASYVAIEIAVDGTGGKAVAYNCTELICRLLKVDDRISYTVKGSWWSMYNVERAAQG